MGGSPKLSIQEAAIGLAERSRKAQDSLARQRAKAFFARQDTSEAQASYRCLAKEEAMRLGKSMMLRTGALRLMPFFGGSALQKIRTESEQVYEGNLLNVATHKIVSPLLFATEPDGVESINLVSGWRVVARTVGSFGGQIMMAASQHGGQYNRRLDSVAIEQVAQNFDEPKQEPVVRASTIYYTGGDIKGGLEESSDYPLYFDQLVMLKAIRAELGYRTTTAGIPVADLSLLD
jgi:hypothetical protein